jgi:hypothetical protein
VADYIDGKKLTLKVNEVGEAVGADARRTGRDPAQAQAVNDVSRAHDLASQAEDRVRLSPNCRRQMVWSDIAEQMLARAEEIERDARVEELHEPFRAMMIRHLGIADRLVENTSVSVCEQAVRVRRRAELGADTAVSQKLLAALEDALRRRLAYRERLSRDLGNPFKDDDPAA